MGGKKREGGEGIEDDSGKYLTGTCTSPIEKPFLNVLKITPANTSPIASAIVWFPTDEYKESLLKTISACW